MDYYYIDGHADTLLNYRRYPQYQFDKYNQEGHIDLPRLREGQVGLVFFSVFVESSYKPQLVFERMFTHLDSYFQLLATVPGVLGIKKFEDMQDLPKKTGILLTLEGGEVIKNLSVLRVLYRLGFRLITLTWNQRNQLADGAGEYRANGGLTDLGRQVVKEMNRLGMIVDVSHLAPASFWDVIRVSEQPVVASHSNVRELCKHPRNLSDNQLRAIADTGGVIGVNFCPYFLNNSSEADISEVIKHIHYIEELVGYRHVALGTDFDGIELTPGGLEDVSRLPVLEQSLSEDGWSETQIRHILQLNWFKLLRRVL